MKRSILLATAALLVTGAASAHLLTATSQAPTAKLSVPEKPLPVKALLSDPLAKPVGQPSPPPVLRNASVDIRQAPVPLQARFRKPVALPLDDTSDAYAKAEGGLSANSATGDESNESAARAAINADGYKDVQILRGHNGVWHAKALRGKTAVLLMVDSKGTVTTAD
ncbi:MAG: hypothetical protein Q8M19_09660 [Reyranella sp.]|nr:hypothetical protein [Reyranella sp.]